MNSLLNSTYNLFIRNEYLPIVVLIIFLMLFLLALSQYTPDWKEVSKEHAKRRYGKSINTKWIDSLTPIKKTFSSNHLDRIQEYRNGMEQSTSQLIIKEDTDSEFLLNQTLKSHSYKSNSSKISLSKTKDFKTPRITINYGASTSKSSPMDYKSSSPFGKTAFTKIVNKKDIDLDIDYINSVIGKSISKSPNETSEIDDGTTNESLKRFYTEIFEKFSLFLEFIYGILTLKSLFILIALPFILVYLAGRIFWDLYQLFVFIIVDTLLVIAITTINVSKSGIIRMHGFSLRTFSLLHAFFSNKVSLFMMNGIEFTAIWMYSTGIPFAFGSISNLGSLTLKSFRWLETTGGPKFCIFLENCYFDYFKPITNVTISFFSLLAMTTMMFFSIFVLGFSTFITSTIHYSSIVSTKLIGFYEFSARKILFLIHNSTGFTTFITFLKSKWSLLDKFFLQLVSKYIPIFINWVSDVAAPTTVMAINTIYHEFLNFFTLICEDFIWYFKMMQVTLKLVVALVEELPTLFMQTCSFLERTKQTFLKIIKSLGPVLQEMRRIFKRYRTIAESMAGVVYYKTLLVLEKILVIISKNKKYVLPIISYIENKLKLVYILYLRDATMYLYTRFVKLTLYISIHTTNFIIETVPTYSSIAYELIKNKGKSLSKLFLAQLDLAFRILYPIAELATKQIGAYANGLYNEFSETAFLVMYNTHLFVKAAASACYSLIGEGNEVIRDIIASTSEQADRFVGTWSENFVPKYQEKETNKNHKHFE
ncbi:hypothetical protein BB558_006668 [Smittium angustum]|uniref:Uncharacterized protein n=1 Tax=Smittium angustum TaxID=133377 RepID=A0A2U1IX37_SMIAN|nr:hypothetical protein BB558_006668 [Smittium angustum]